jgi:hypothetical protein
LVRLTRTLSTTISIISGIRASLGIRCIDSNMQVTGLQHGIACEGG